MRRLSRWEVERFALRRASVAPQFIGKDPDSPTGESPTVWEDGDDFVIQGWAVTVPGEVAELLRASGKDAVPPHEGLIRFPKRLSYLFTGDAG
jgi:hypothetical protein